MYIPKHFESPTQELTLEAMRRYNFATLVSVEKTGEPIASHIPMVVEAGEPITLHFHLARANPLANVLRETRRATVMFLGPHAYMSPSVYPDLKRVPTWNYIAVHAYGDVVELDGEAAKDGLLKSLIALHEPAYAQQWRDLDSGYQSRQMSAITAFRLDVTRLDSSFKLNQHRKEALEAMKKTYAAGNDNERDLAQWMERFGS